MEVIIHNKQFFIYDSNIFSKKIPDKYKTYYISENIVLAYSESIEIKIIKRSNGDVVVILGLFLGECDNYNDSYYNSGRFVIINNGVLSLDAAGSLGVFYSSLISNGVLDLSGLICGSSLALLSELSGKKIEGPDLSKRTINWDPSPMARLNNFTRLFIDQAIDLKTLKVTQVPRGASKLNKDLDYISKELGEYFVNLLKFISNLKRPIFLALTAGADSRLLFAALIKSNLQFQCYTFDLGSEASKIDCSYAKALCDVYGITHNIYTSNGNNIAAYEKYKLHTANAGGDQAFKYVKGNYYSEFPSNALVLHGGVFGIGRSYYEKRLNKINFNQPEKAVAQIEAVFRDKLDLKSKVSLKKWILYRSENPIINVNWSDTFFLDQRRAAWGASNRQAEDIFEFDWIVLANSWYVIERLLSPDVNDRRNNVLQKMTSEYLLPGITSVVPINSVTKKLKFRLFISSLIPKMLKPIILKLWREI